MYVARDMNRRTYDMQSRGAAAAATREAIVQAAIDTFMTEHSFSIALEPVARRAGVTTKTLLRHFGNRDSLIEAAWQRVYQDVVAERTPSTDGPDAALSVLIDHYETRGLTALGVLAEEDDDPRAKRMNDVGRAGHRAWVEDVFGARLPEPGPERSRALDVLVVATDVYAWKLLRLDRGLSPVAVHDRMTLMTSAVITASGGPTGDTDPERSAS